MKVVAVDPGKTCGLAWWKDDLWQPVLQQAPLFDAIYRVHSALEGAKLDYVVCEEFVITPATTKKTRQTDALDGIGALRYLTALYDVPFVPQRAAEAKVFASNVLLKKIGWYVPGQEHARDASRHLVLALVRLRVVTPAALVRAVEERSGREKGAPGTPSNVVPLPRRYDRGG